MRVAALYDIHGNLPALEVVLRAVVEEGVDQVVVGGDVVPGPMPKGCLSALLELDLPVRYLKGNGDADVLAAHRGEEPTRVPPRFRQVVRWAADELGQAHLTAMAAWPATLGQEIPNLGAVCFCHATPRDDNEVFTRDTPESRLKPIFEAPGAAVVVCGHTHMQFQRRVGAVTVVNAGSVGMPFGEPGAYWALLAPDGVELRHTPYELDAAAERIGRTGYPSEFDVKRPPGEAEMLRRFEAAALR